jgi:uncharacterized protein (DUF58 family)
LDPEAARVRFPGDLPRRIERCVPRLAAELARREGQGSARLQGRGLEWVGFRPYRSGDDASQIDPSLLARLGRPFVRETRREGSSRWLLALDQSASLAVGRPSKLQALAEIAAALCALALRAKARITLLSMAAGAAEHSSARTTLERSADLLRGLRFLSELRASGRDGAWRAPPELADCARVFWLSDPFVGEPRVLDGWLAQGREVTVVHALAPLESAPPSAGLWRWRCPETGQLRSVLIDAANRERYSAQLEARLSAWAQHAAARRVRHVLVSSAEPFEAAMPRLLGSSSAPAGGRGPGPARGAKAP